VDPDRHRRAAQTGTAARRLAQIAAGITLAGLLLLLAASSTHSSADGTA
jgi:hypothetical protein